MISASGVPEHLLQIANQIFDLEKKLYRLDNPDSMLRNLNRIKRSLDAVGLSFHDPFGEDYDETRTDCEASISGPGSTDLVISEVIKPIIWYRQDGLSRIVQRAVVIVQQHKA